LMKRRGLVCVEHVEFAERLAQLSGCPYYGAKGLTTDGEFIDDANPKRCAILSVDANKEGRNLQSKWSRNLLVTPPPGSDELQQIIARTHRPGQTADEVEVDVFLGCMEHANAWRNALVGAEVVRDTMGEEQKILLADVSWPTDDEIARYRGARWVNVANDDVTSRPRTWPQEREQHVGIR
jgi:hypothetical protein